MVIMFRFYQTSNGLGKFTMQEKMFISLFHILTQYASTWKTHAFPF